MKRIGKLFAVLVALFVIASPVVVKADMLQLECEGYSKFVSVGSEFIFAVNVGQNSFDGTVTFDNTILEVKTVTNGPIPQPNDTIGPNIGKVTHNVSGNQLNLNFTPDGYKEYIYVTFKVKDYPSMGTTTVKVKANTNNWFGEPYATMNVIKPTECPTCEKDEVSCPVCEECEKCELASDAKKDTTSKESKETDSKDILLYSALGACGFLAVVVIILAIRKK